MLREAHIEAIVEQWGGGKRIAFTALAATGTLGIAVENEPGYYAVPDYWHQDPNYDSLSAYADELNAAIGLSPPAASDIVVSSMRKSV